MLLDGIECGNSLDVLQSYPDDIFDCCVTSPPYLMLRNYQTTGIVWPDGWHGELGQEPTTELYVEHLMLIFDEVKRCLKPTGACWVVIGDTYGTKSGGMNQLVKYGAANTPQYGQLSYGFEGVAQNSKPKKYNKSLLQIPARFAIAMQEHGWTLRNDLIWKKPNAMPSSAKDRFTVDYEHIYFFTKSNRTLYYVNDAIGKIVKKRPPGIKGKEGIDWHYNKKGKKISNWVSRDYYFDTQYEPYKSDDDMPKVGGSKKRKGHGYMECVWDQERTTYGRIKRSVWEITTKAYHGLHYAVYPPQLVETALAATCPRYQCSNCGLGFTTRYDEIRIPTRPGKSHKTIKQFDDDNPYTNDEWHLTKPLLLRYKSGSDANDPNYEFHQTDLSRYREKIIRRLKNVGGPEYAGKALKDYVDNGAQVPGDTKSSILESMDKLKFNGGYSKCECNAPTMPGLVLDPFAGSGTTLVVARQMQRDYFGIEVSADYVRQAEKRLFAALMPQSKSIKKVRKNKKEELTLLHFITSIQAAT